MSALWHHEQHRLGLPNMGYGEEGTRMVKSAPCSPMKAQGRPADLLGGLLAGFEAHGGLQKEANDFHVVHKVPVGDSPYVRAKHVQLVDKDPEKAIALFWKAINANDRVDSALKDMAIVMKQQGRSEEAIEAIRSLRSKCSEAAQESLDNVLLDLFKRCGRLDDQIDLLKHKLNLIHQGLAFNGKRTKTARSQGKKFQVSIEQEATRLLGNLGWAYMQQDNFLAAEAVYRKALSIEPDNNKMCNLGICLMKQFRIDEARAILNNVTPAGEGKWGSESHQKSYERAQEMLREIEASQRNQPGSDAEARNRASYFQARAPTLLQLQQRKNAQPELQNVADALRAILSEPGFGRGADSGFARPPQDEDEESLCLLPPSRTVTPPVFSLPGDLASPSAAPLVEPTFMAPLPRQHCQVAPPQQPNYHARPMSAPLQRVSQFRRANAPLPQGPKPKQGYFPHHPPPFVPQKQASLSWGAERHPQEQPFMAPQNENRYYSNGPHPMGPPHQKTLHGGTHHTSQLRPPSANVLARTNPSPQEQTVFTQPAPRYAPTVNRPHSQGVNRPPAENLNGIQSVNRPSHVKSPAAKALFSQPQVNHRYSPQEPIHTAASVLPTTVNVKSTVERYEPLEPQRKIDPLRPYRAASAPLEQNGGVVVEQNVGGVSEEALSRAKSAPDQTETLPMPQPVRSVLGPRFSGVTRVSSPSKINSPRRSFERLPSFESERGGVQKSALYHSASLPTEIDERPWESDHENENIPQDVSMVHSDLGQQNPPAAGVKRNRVLTPVKDNQKQEGENSAWQSLGFSSSPLSFPKEGGPVRAKGIFMAVLEAAAAKQGGGDGKGSPNKGGSPQMKVEPKRQRRLRVFEEIAQEGM